MSDPFHEFDTEAQERALAQVWPRLTYPWTALAAGVRWLVRPNGEVPLSWADLSAFAGAERLEGEAWTAMGYWVGLGDHPGIAPLTEARGDDVDPAAPRALQAARGYPVVHRGNVVAVAWDDGRVQLQAGLELLEAHVDLLVEVVARAGAALVDLLVLGPEQRRAIHAHWSPTPLADGAYAEAGHPEYWRVCHPRFADDFVAVFSDLADTSDELAAFLRWQTVPSRIPPATLRLNDFA